MYGSSGSPASSGEPHPVAAVTVILTHRRDHADRTYGARKTEIGRQPITGRTGHGLERADTTQPLQHLGGRHEFVRAHVQVVADRHDFDEAHMPWPLDGATGEVLELIVVAATHDDGVHLDRLEAHPFGRGKPREDRLI